MARHLRDKVVLITGASSGIGRATALACAWAGMHVSLAARREDRLQKVARQVSQLNRKAHYFTCNVTNRDDVKKMCENVYETHGRLDAVFANAGVGLDRPLMETGIPQHRELFDVNYFGTVHLLHEAFPFMHQTEGGLKHMLVCSSALSALASPGRGLYSATKAAQASIVQAMRAELSSDGFSVTSVHPVGTNTEFHEQTADRSGLDYKGGTNTPKWLTQSPERVAKSVVKVMRKPRAEVWPQPMARYAFAAAQMFPGITASLVARRYAKERRA